MTIAEILKTPAQQQPVTARGWVRTFRSNRFIALNDGSTGSNVQCVVDFENTPEDVLKRITTGAAIEVRGRLVASQGSGQAVEIQVNEVIVHGDSSPEEYPLQPKRHSLEFLREIAHLRPRTATKRSMRCINFFTSRDFTTGRRPSSLRVMPRVPARCFA